MIKQYEVIFKKSDSDKPVEEKANFSQPTTQSGTTNTSAGQVGKAVAIQFGQQALNYSLSNYGDLTGNYIMQENIQSGLQLLSLGAMAMTGPIGLGVAVLSIGTQVASKVIQTQKQNREINFLRERVGLYSERSR